MTTADPSPLGTVSRPVSVLKWVDPLTLPDWDAIAASLPGSSVFHGAAWARVLHRTYGFAPRYLINYADGVAQAALPLFEAQSWLTGRRGISLPFTDECPPLCSGGSAFHPLWKEALAQGKARSWRYLELRGGTEYFAGDSAFQPSTSFWGHTLPLTATESDLLQSFDSATRRAIRKAETQGVTTEISPGPAAMEEFYRLFCLTRRRHGVPPQPWRFFSHVQDELLARGHGFVALARHGTRAVAGAVFLHSGGTALYKFGASDLTDQHLRANNLVMWAAIRHLRSLGFTSLNFGRTSLNNDGLRRFKLSWGTTEHKVDYMKHDFAQSGFVIESDRASGGFHTRLVRLLPLSLSRLAGALLYRHAA